MDKTGVSRVNYFPRQILRTQDFEDEQAYHVQARRRHNIGHHIWGIVSGLELKKDKEGTIFVAPGFAVDGFGRELVLPASRTIPGRAFDEKLADALDVWAVYSRMAGDRGDPAYQPCDPASTRSPYRWAEIASIEWTRSGSAERLRQDPQLGVPECRQPPDVSAEDLKFDPTRGAPDDPAVRWPVFLGRIDRTVSGKETKYVIDMSGRPYAGARAEAIVAPAEDAWLQIGTACDANDYRFALFLKEQAQNRLPSTPRLALGADGNWQVRGSTTVRGDVTIEGGAVGFGNGAVYTQPKPWRIYRVQFDEANAEDQTRRIDELRIEMKAPDAEASNKVVIGVFSQAGEFKPCLTIADDCNVTVHGDLIVQGHIQEQTRVSGALSDQANALAASMFVSGLMQSFTLAVGGRQPELSFIDAALRTQPEATIDAVASFVKQHPVQLERLLAAIEVPETKVAAPPRSKPAPARKRGMPLQEGGGGEDDGPPKE